MLSPREAGEREETGSYEETGSGEQEVEKSLSVWGEEEETTSSQEKMDSLIFVRHNMKLGTFILSATQRCLYFSTLYFNSATV